MAGLQLTVDVIRAYHWGARYLVEMEVRPPWRAAPCLLMSVPGVILLRAYPADPRATAALPRAGAAAGGDERARECGPPCGCLAWSALLPYHALALWRDVSQWLKQVGGVLTGHDIALMLQHKVRPPGRLPCLMRAPACLQSRLPGAQNGLRAVRAANPAAVGCRWRRSMRWSARLCT